MSIAETGPNIGLSQALGPDLLVGQQNLISCEQLVKENKHQIEQMLADPIAQVDFQLSLKHGEAIQEIAASEEEKLREFKVWLPEALSLVVSKRKLDPNLAPTVLELDQAGAQKILAKAELSYLVESRLVGPLIVHFADSIKTWQDEGLLPGASVAMLRDFQPFYAALQVFKAKVEPWYLRRAMFCIDDELTPEDEAKVGAVQNGKLALWLEPLLTTKHLNLLDSGCWGTVVYDMATFRTILSWMGNSGVAEKLALLRSPLRADALHSCLPSELECLLNTGLSPNEVKMRWGLIHAIIGDDHFLEIIQEINGYELTTTGIDHYSHAWQDPRLSPFNHQQIYSHIDVLAGGAMPDKAFGECVNDTIEENGASKGMEGPTVLEVQEGVVSVLVKPNPSLEGEVIALASCKGVEHAAQIALKRKYLSLGLIDPQETVAHMAELAEKRDKCGVYTGVLPHTPTWSMGKHFVSGIWPKLNNQFSTYKPFIPEKGVIL